MDNLNGSVGDSDIGEDESSNILRETISRKNADDIACLVLDVFRAFSASLFW